MAEFYHLSITKGQAAPMEPEQQWIRANIHQLKPLRKSSPHHVKASRPWLFNFALSEEELKWEEEAAQRLLYFLMSNYLNNCVTDHHGLKLGT